MYIFRYEIKDCKDSKKMCVLLLEREFFGICLRCNYLKSLQKIIPLQIGKSKFERYEESDFCNYVFAAFCLFGTI